MVIGKNFGDEGKGAMVNRLCHGKNALVVRHNGGAQAGHTVEEGNFRFVFHQLGSGSLQGCPTYWSRTFLPDLFKLGEEVEEFESSLTNAEPIVSFSNSRTGACLLNNGGRTKWPGILYAHPDCACTTIYDVLLNSLTEQLRGRKKHGSCGMGIFETVVRTGEEQYALYLRDFAGADVSEIAGKLQNIRDGYTKVRLEKLHAEYAGEFHRIEIRKWAELIEDENVLWNSARIMWENFQKYVVIADWKHLIRQYGTIIFENAQGLMLDWDNEEYAPHLTASYTGLKNVAELLGEQADASEDFGECEKESQAVPDMEIIYISRTYVTRHGAGRLDYECTGEEINPQMVDRTNVPNPWQDALRYAKHPAGEDFFRYIRKDLKYLEALKNNTFGTLHPVVTLFLTHMDETEGKVLFPDISMSFEEFCHYCREQAPGLIQIISHG